jgi:hypothetical protein
MQEAQFAYPNDPEAQQEAVRRAKFDGGESGGKPSSLDKYQSLAADVLGGMRSWLFDEEKGIFAEANRSGQDSLSDLAGPLNVIPRAVRTGWNYLGQGSDVAKSTKAYIDTAKGRMAPIVKALGDSGNVGVNEAENLYKSLPNPWTDLPDTAAEKWDGLVTLLAKQLKAASKDPEWVKKYGALFAGGELPPGLTSTPPQSGQGFDLKAYEEAMSQPGLTIEDMDAIDKKFGVTR